MDEKKTHTTTSLLPELYFILNKYGFIITNLMFLIKCLRALQPLVYS